MSCTVEIIGVGNELLIGKIANTNAQWLAKVITSLGGTVRRITDIGDNVRDISAVVREALASKHTWIIITGGLGPTFDDLTLGGIAKALEVPLEINPEARDMIEARYERYAATTGEKIELTPARLKMATLPRGGKPLRNSAGTAPGVLIQQADTTIAALPGVPKEMQTIFEEVLGPLIRETTKYLSYHAKSLKAVGVIESALAPMIERVMRGNPKVYIKSHPKAPEPLPTIELHLSNTSKTLEEAKIEVMKAGKELSQLILDHGGRVEEIDTEDENRQ